MEELGQLYKVLGEHGNPVNGGHGTWSLPQGDEPGAWMPTIYGELMPCRRGYHLARQQDLIDWLGPVIYEAEYRPLSRAQYTDLLIEPHKVVVKSARLIRRLDTWNDRTARLFACDCAERAVQRHASSNPVLLAAIAVTRWFADGIATAQELAAARDAAWDAARAAAWDAAWGAAWDAARDAAWDAAWDAARAAAWAAAWAAAGGTTWAAAGGTERAWQTQRLLEYLYPEKEKAIHVRR